MINVIADIGGNICNDIDKGKRLIDLAKKAGANSVKLQLYKFSDLYVADYFNNITGANLSSAACEQLFKYAKEKQINIFSSVFSTGAIDYLYSLGSREFKIAAFECNRIDLLTHLAQFDKLKIHFSVGLLNKAEMTTLVSVLGKTDHELIAYHSVSNYTGEFKPDGFGLGRIPLIKNYLPNASIGFSDHTQAYLPAALAIALGATYIEKHLRASDVCPEKFALPPNEFKNFIDQVKATEKVLSDKVPEDQEIALKSSIIAIEEIAEGEEFTKKNIRCFRGRSALAPAKSAIYYLDVIGTRSNKKYGKGDFLDGKH